MPEPQAYLNGRFVPASQAAVSVVDAGFVQGTAVAEQLRTFGGKLFELDAHLDRLFHSMAIVGVDAGMSRDKLAGVARQLVEMNHPLLETGDDLGLAMFVTPGGYRPMTGEAPARPTVCLHTFPLRFHLWAAKYRSGESLSTTDVAQISERSWPRELKCRSRMHYYLADRQAQAREPGSRALMRDEDGFVTETTTSNIVIYDRRVGLVMPPRAKILPGISMAVALRLAAQLGLAHTERDLRPEDVIAADEVLLTATSSCVLPVARLNGQPIGNGSPGDVCRQLLSAWSSSVGLDIVAQAERFATASSSARR